VIGKNVIEQKCATIADFAEIPAYTIVPEGTCP
jgi:hypothetical protein